LQVETTRRAARVSVVVLGDEGGADVDAAAIQLLGGDPVG
jgi:hypothetical protein